MTISETTDARRERIGEAEATQLLQDCRQLIVAKGKKVETLELNSKSTPSDLVRSVLGPTGNLRAPTIRVGSTLVVGFSDEAYSKVLGL